MTDITSYARRRLRRSGARLLRWMRCWLGRCAARRCAWWRRGAAARRRTATRNSFRRTTTRCWRGWSSRRRLMTWRLALRNERVSLGSSRHASSARVVVRLKNCGAAHSDAPLRSPWTASSLPPRRSSARQASRAAATRGCRRAVSQARLGSPGARTARGLATVLRACTPAGSVRRPDAHAAASLAGAAPQARQWRGRILAPEIPESDSAACAYATMCPCLALGENYQRRALRRRCSSLAPLAARRGVGAGTRPFLRCAHLCRRAELSRCPSGPSWRTRCSGSSA
jgi:hypothetical protein